MSHKNLALRLFEAVTLAFRPGSVSARRIRWARLVDLGVQSCRENNLVRAEAQFRSAGEAAEVLDPAGFELGISKYNLAMVLYRCNQLDGAEAEHQRALALFDNNARTLYAHVHRSAVDLARVYRAQGKCDAALELLRRTLATHDDEIFFPGAAFAELLDEISETLVEKGDLLGAEQISRFTLMCWEQLFGEGQGDLDLRGRWQWRDRV